MTKGEGDMRSRLNVVLAERRMSKARLCELMGVSHTTVWRWSTDEHVGEMTVSTLARLADVIGCEPCELFEWDDGDSANRGTGA